MITEVCDSIGFNHSPHPGNALGIEALKAWLRESKNTRASLYEKKRVEALVSYTQAIADYLENTRAIAWLTLQNNDWQPINKAELLDLFQQQVELVHNCKAILTRLKPYTNESPSCPDGHIRDLELTIEELIVCETKIRELLDS
ncbi:MAG: hypothetical protein MI922_06310 [Bacteroidales bacterium]|nr:hypothetical protein [Bacteroidales bacterium]